MTDVQSSVSRQSLHMMLCSFLTDIRVPDRRVKEATVRVSVYRQDGPCQLKHTFVRPPNSQQRNGTSARGRYGLPKAESIQQNWLY